MSGRDRAGVHRADAIVRGYPRLVGSRPVCGFVVENPPSRVRARGGTAAGCSYRVRSREAPCTRPALLAAASEPEPPREWWSRKRREGEHPLHGNGFPTLLSWGSDASRTKQALPGAEPAGREEHEKAGSDLGHGSSCTVERVVERSAAGSATESRATRGRKSEARIDGGVPGRGSVGAFTSDGVSRPRSFASRANKLTKADEGRQGRQRCTELALTRPNTPSETTQPSTEARNDVVKRRPHRPTRQTRKGDECRMR